MNRTYVTLNSKHYAVEFYDAITHSCGGISPARVSIWTSWEVPSIADRWSVKPAMITKTRYVDMYGRLGKKIMAAAAAQGDTA